METLLFIGIVFEVLAGPLIVILGMLGLFLALSTEPVYSIIPIAFMAGGLWVLFRRKRAEAMVITREIEAGHIPPPPREHH